jgi:hypothetical protein
MLNAPVLVGTRDASFHEIVEGIVGGYLASSDDDDNVIAARGKELALSPTEHKAVGKQARRTVSRFDGSRDLAEL